MMQQLKQEILQEELAKMKAAQTKKEPIIDKFTKDELEANLGEKLDDEKSE